MEFSVIYDTTIPRHWWKFPAIHAFMLYGRGRHYASSERVQNLQNETQAKKKQKQGIECHQECLNPEKLAILTNYQWHHTRTTLKFLFCRNHENTKDA